MILYLTAQTISAFGDSFRRFTIMLWVLSVTNGSGLAVTAVLAAEMIPYLFLSAIGGMLVDRWSPRKVLLLCDIARGIVGLGLVLAAAFGQVWIGIALVVVLTIFSIFSDLAGIVLYPHLTDDKNLERANALWTMGQQLSLVAGPGLAALMFTQFGAQLAFALDALSFGIAFLITVSAFRNLALPRDSILPPVKPRDIRTEIKEGWVYLAQTPMIRNSFIAALFQVAGAGINSTIMIFFISRNLGHPITDVAWLSSVNGLSQIVAGGAIAVLARRSPLHVVLSVGGFLILIGAIFVASATSLTILIIGVVLTALGNSPANIGRSTLEQRYVPTALLGRTRGLAETSSPIVFLTTSMVAGSLVTTLDPRIMLIGSTFFSMASLLAIMATVMQIRSTISNIKENS
jgi:MFS family permease